MGFNFGKEEASSQQQSKQSSSSSSQSQATSNPVDLTPEAFQDMQPDLATSLVNWFTGGNPSLTPGGGGFGGGGASADWAQYGEQNFALPEGVNEQTIRQLLMGDLSGPRQQLLSDTQQGVYTNPNTNPFLNDYIKAAQRTTLEGLTETLDRALPGRFTQAGQFVQPGGSSAFDRAAAIATRGSANAISDIASNIGYNAYQGERGHQQASIQAGQQETQTTIANLTAQGLPRIIQQYGVDKGLELFKVQLAGILDALKTASSLAQPTIGQESQSTSSSKSESKGTSTGTSESSGFNVGLKLSPTPPGV